MCPYGHNNFSSTIFVHVLGKQPIRTLYDWTILELLTLPEHLSSPPVFSGVLVTRTLVLFVCFVDRCLSFRTFSFQLQLQLQFCYLVTSASRHLTKEYYVHLWPLCCLFFFDLRILITPMVSSNSSYTDLVFGFSALKYANAFVFRLFNISSI